MEELIALAKKIQDRENVLLKKIEAYEKQLEELELIAADKESLEKQCADLKQLVLSTEQANAAQTKQLEAVKRADNENMRKTQSELQKQVDDLKLVVAEQASKIRVLEKLKEIQDQLERAEAGAGV